MWKTNNGLLQERVVMPDTGLTKIISVTIKGTGVKAEQEAAKRLEAKIASLCEKRMKFSEAIDLYIRECEKELKPSTVRKYKFEFISIYKIVGECYLDHVTAGFIRKAFMDSGRENRTLNGYIKIFKSFWMWAYRNDYVKGREVVDKLTLFPDTPKRERIQDKYLEADELKTLFEDMTEERWYLVSRFLCLTGMRIGEFIALERTDIWGSVIRITKTYDANNHVVTSPKSFDSKREIFVQSELRDCIADINKYVKNMKEKTGIKSDLFFPDFNGEHLRYEAYAKYLRELSQRSIGRVISPHIWRHTHASILFSRGASLDTVSTRLGHADSKITKEIYLHRLEELKEKENKFLDGITMIG